MSKVWIACVGLGVAAGCAVPAFSADVKLNVSTGLWQVTTTTQTSGAPPIPPEELANLTPEQRAKVMATMQAVMANAAKPRNFTECVTEDQLRKGFNTDPNDKDRCVNTVLSNTGSVLQVKMVCNGADPQYSGTMTFRAAGPHAVTGESNLVATGHGKTMTIKSNVSGKWVSGDCGSLKPGESQDAP
jgi:hypothetical protein